MSDSTGREKCLCRVSLVCGWMERLTGRCERGQRWDLGLENGCK